MIIMERQMVITNKQIWILNLEIMQQIFWNILIKHQKDLIKLCKVNILNPNSEMVMLLQIWIRKNSLSNILKRRKTTKKNLRLKVSLAAKCLLHLVRKCQLLREIDCIIKKTMICCRKMTKMKIKSILTNLRNSSIKEKQSAMTMHRTLKQMK